MRSPAPQSPLTPAGWLPAVLAAELAGPGEPALFTRPRPDERTGRAVVGPSAARFWRRVAEAYGGSRGGFTLAQLQRALSEHHPITPPALGDVLASLRAEGAVVTAAVSTLRIPPSPARPPARPRRPRRPPARAPARPPSTCCPHNVYVSVWFVTLAASR